MEGIIVLGLLNMGLCIWITKLQNRIAKQHLLIEIMHEGILKVANGEVCLVRTKEGFKFEMTTKGV